MGGGAAGKAAGKGKATPGGGGGGQQPAPQETFKEYGDGPREEIADRLQLEYNDWANKLSSEEVNALFDYQGHTHDPLNKLLRGIPGKLHGPAGLQHLRDVQSRLDKAIAKGSLKTSTIVYRGITPNAVAKLAGSAEGLVGKTFIDNGFMSTSVSRQTAEGFATTQGVVVRLAVPRGTRAAVPLSATGIMRTETEILLGRGTRIRINRVRRVGDTTIADAVIVH